MRKALMTFTIAAVASALGLAATGQASAAKTLVYAVYIPATHVLVQKSVKPFLHKVEETSKGSLKFNFYPGGSMITGKTSLDGIGGGVVDGGQIVDAYTPTELPHVNVVSGLALLASDSRASAGAVAETVLLDCPSCIQDFLKANVVPLANNSTAPYNLICTKPANTLKKLKGMRLRSPGAFGPWANALGATPVNISSAEAYQGLERGQLDCTFGAVGWLKSYSLWDVAKYVVDYPMGLFQGDWLYSLNKKTWDGLNKQQKQAIISNLAYGVRTGVQAYLDEARSVKKEAMKRGNITFLKAGEGIKRRLAEHREAEKKRVAEVARGRGVKHPEKIINTFEKNLAKWRKKVAKMGNDFDAYQKALNDEVFSKVDYSAY